MRLSIERQMYMKAVSEGLLGAEHLTDKEILKMHDMLSEQEIIDNLFNQSDRHDVTVFDFNYEPFIVLRYN